MFMEWFLYSEAKRQPIKVDEQILKYKIINHEVSPDFMLINSETKKWVAVSGTRVWKKYAGLRHDEEKHEENQQEKNIRITKAFIRKAIICIGIAVYILFVALTIRFSYLLRKETGNNAELSEKLWAAESNIAEIEKVAETK